MKKSPLIFATGNPKKAVETVAIWKALGVRIVPRHVETLELQSYDLLEIVREKAIQAHSELGVAVVVEDVALDVEALGGFPGPFVKFWQKGPGYDKLVSIAKSLRSSAATVRCGMAYTRDGVNFVQVVGVVRGRLVPPRLESGFGFDPYFVPEGQEMTFAEMGSEQKNRISHRSLAIWSLCRELREEQYIPERRRSQRGSLSDIKT